MTVGWVRWAQALVQHVPRKEGLPLPMRVTPAARLPLTHPSCLQNPESVDPQPSMLCSSLQVSDSGVVWSEVWATIPASEPLELVLHLQRDSQV